ncbi:MAG: hypothetical protein ACRD0P_07865, partial [Stackebrandtia sp.]
GGHASGVGPSDQRRQVSDSAGTRLTVTGSTGPDRPVDGPWRARFDAVADDLRAALRWAASVPERRADAYCLAVSLAELAFARNLAGESQERYEQAATLADDLAAAAAYRSAAAVAGCRLLGDDVYRLHRAAANAATRAGDTVGAAVDLATAATAAHRFSGAFTSVPPLSEAVELLTKARALATPPAVAAADPDRAGDVTSREHAADSAVDDTANRTDEVSVPDVSAREFGNSAPTADPATGGAGVVPAVGAPVRIPSNGDRAANSSPPSAEGTGKVGVPSHLARDDSSSPALEGAGTAGAGGPLARGDSVPPVEETGVSGAARGMAGEDVVGGPRAHPADGGSGSGDVSRILADGVGDVPVREAGCGDPAAVAAVALAEAAVFADAFGSDQGPAQVAVPETIAAAERAVELARGAGDPLTTSAALDALAGSRSWAGNSFAAAETARGRVELLSYLPATPAATHELTDALVSGVDTSLGVGDLATARRWGRRLAQLPLLAEVGHYATSWLLTADALAGNMDDVLAASERFREAWERTGRLRAPRLGATAAAVAMTHGLRGDDAARAQWLGIAERLGSTPDRSVVYGAVFDGLVHLHYGNADAALAGLSAEPEDVWKWVTWIWLHWYVALRAEATVLAGDPAAAERLTRARTVVAGNPVAAGIVGRAEGLFHGDRDRVLATAAVFEDAGCRYQAARSVVLAGGEHAARGEVEVAKLGLASMAATSGRNGAGRP